MKWERNQNEGTKVKVEEQLNETRHGNGRYHSRSGKIMEQKGSLGLRIRLTGIESKLQKVIWTNANLTVLP